MSIDTVYMGPRVSVDNNRIILELEKTKKSYKVHFRNGEKISDIADPVVLEKIQNIIDAFLDNKHDQLESLSGLKIDKVGVKLGNNQLSWDDLNNTRAQFDEITQFVHSKIQANLPLQSSPIKKAGKVKKDSKSSSIKTKLKSIFKKIGDFFHRFYVRLSALKIHLHYVFNKQKEEVMAEQKKDIIENMLVKYIEVTEKIVGEETYQVYDACPKDVSRCLMKVGATSFNSIESNKKGELFTAIEGVVGTKNAVNLITRIMHQGLQSSTYSKASESIPKDFILSGYESSDLDSIIYELKKEGDLVTLFAKCLYSSLDTESELRGGFYKYATTKVSIPISELQVKNLDVDVEASQFPKLRVEEYISESIRNKNIAIEAFKLAK